MVADSMSNASAEPAAQAAQENSEAENPALAACGIRKALMLERVARKAVSSEPAPSESKVAHGQTTSHEHVSK
jgi:transcription elongation GreA/GreB family factor